MGRWQRPQCLGVLVDMSGWKGHGSILFISRERYLNLSSVPRLLICQFHTYETFSLVLYGSGEQFAATSTSGQLFKSRSNL